MKKHSIIIMVCIALCCMAVPAAAADLSSPELPTTASITKDNDVSASFLSNLLGPSWRGIAGGAAMDHLGGMQRYHGLLIGFLSMLNFAALAFISVSILYHWGLFAVVTAHEGKRLGGSVYNSLWVPVRHAFSFALAVPILNGLSLLQVGVLTCVAFSINFSNQAWDWAGQYIVNHSQAGMIDNSSPLIEDESLTLIQPIFQAAVISEYLRVLSSAYGSNEHFNDTIKAKPLPTTVNRQNIREYKSVEIVADRYVVEREPLDGAITVYIAPGRGMPLGQLGAVTINTVKRSFNNETGQLVPMSEVGIALENIAEARVQALIEASDDLRRAARHYLQLRGIYDYKYGHNHKSGLEIARRYRQVINAATEQWVSSIKNANDTKALLEKALDSKDGESRLGWVSAGLFSSALAQRQRAIDELVYGSVSRFEYPPSDLPDQNVVGDIARFFGSKNTVREISREAYAAFNAAPLWASDYLLDGRVYADRDAEGDGPSLINRTLSAIFLNGTGENGLVATTLSKLRAYDPIVVLSDFGNKMWETAAWLAGGSAIAGLFGSAGVLTSAMLGCFALGVTLKIIAPLTVVSIWLYAVLHWAVRVLEALVAAPFWAAMHMLPEGHGFAGAAARKGYTLLMDILARPFLLVLGACVSVAVWIGAAQVFSMIFGSYLNSFTGYSGAGLVTELVLVGTILIFFYYLYTKLFILLISTLPDRLMNWLGSPGGGIGGEEASGAAPLAASGVAAAKGAAMAGNAATGTTAGAKALYDRYNKGKGKDKKEKDDKGDSPASIAEKTTE